jgi:hypothetical protein
MLMLMLGSSLGVSDGRPTRLVAVCSLRISEAAICGALETSPAGWALCGGSAPAKTTGPAFWKG